MTGGTSARRDAVVAEGRWCPSGAAMTDIALLAGRDVIVRLARCLRAVMAGIARSRSDAVVTESRRRPRIVAMANITLL